MAGAREREIDLSGHLLLPGLINAHDHLEFNLFPDSAKADTPMRGNGPTDIYHPDDSPVREHLSMPTAGTPRLGWAAQSAERRHYCGAPQSLQRRTVSTRISQCAYCERLDGRTPSISVPILPSYISKTPRNLPFILHAAEGTDEKAAGEIAGWTNWECLARAPCWCMRSQSAVDEIDLLLRPPVLHHLVPRIQSGDVWPNPLERSC